MSLTSIATLGAGGAKIDGQDATSLYAVLNEIRGLTPTMVAGAAANTKINIAAMRQEDTILAAFDFTASSGAWATLTVANFTIQETHATGTVTAASVAAADTATVNGKVYTAVTGTPANYTEFTRTGTDTACAASLVAAINAREADTGYAVQATNAAAVVTIRAVADGTAGNSIALATSNNTRLAKSGTTLANGTATGGVKTSDTTHDTVLIFWYNKA